MGRNPNTRLGDIAEVEFVAEALRRGFIVSKPQSSNEVYDFILDSGKRLYRVQVKSSAYLYVDADKEVGVQFQVRKYGSDKKGGNNYTAADIDILACYVSAKHFWHFLPIEKLGRASTMRFNFNGNKPRDNWEIFT